MSIRVTATARGGAQRRRGLLCLFGAAVFATVLSPPSGVAQAPSNRVLALDGNGAYVVIPSAADLQDPDVITLEGWLYPTRTPNNKFGSFINKGDGQTSATARSYEVRWTHDNPLTVNLLTVNLFFDLLPGEPNYVFLATPFAPDTWTHFAATFDGAAGTARLIANGVLAAEATAVQGRSLAGRKLRQTSLPLILGWTPGYPDIYASGSMDEVRVWNRARTPPEIQETMFCRLPGPEPNLVASWTFDSGAANDVTGNGHNGALMGDARVVALFGADLIHSGGCRPQIGIDLTSLRLEAATGFHFRLMPFGAAARVEVSSNLRDWVTLTNLPAAPWPFEFTDPSATEATHRFYRAVSAGAADHPPPPAGFVWLAPGQFVMGSPANEEDRRSNEGPQTTVVLTQGFFMGQHEVTQRGVCGGDGE